MGHIGHEAAFTGLTGLEIGHLGLQVPRHAVERRPEDAELVGPLWQADIEVAMGHGRRRPARPADRPQQAPGQPVSGERPEDREDHTGGDQHVAELRRLSQAVGLGIEEVERWARLGAPARLRRAQARRPSPIIW